jgi:hypothetical protein
MRIAVSILILASVVFWNSATFGQEPEPAGEVVGDAEEVSEGKGVLHHIAFYVPNRIFDVLDVVRARARVGGGLAVGARATKVAAVFIGSYSSIYVGAQGPRGRPEVPWPFGVDEKTGIQVSVVDRSTSGDFGPRYSTTEVGAGFQLFGVGLDVGVDAFEILDLATGLLLIDLRDDDY